MDELLKSELTIDDNNNVVIGMPICKVDKEKRTVSGFATLDNVDNQKDQVTPEASLGAFSRWRGNIREMHAPVAVGKAVDFQEKPYFDQNTKQEYRGIYVTCYISKGAQSTWDKVLDGTLSGFSIKGPLRKSTNEIAKNGESVRKVLEYDLEELSLVDNPANQLANIMSIEKLNDGELHLEGILSKMAVENIFWCKDDKVEAISPEESLICSKCENQMTNIGWQERDQSRSEAIGTMIKNFEERENRTGINITVNVTGEVTPDEIAKAIKDKIEGKQGGVNVSDKKEEKEEVVKTDEVVEETPVEETTTVEETQEPDLEKMFGDLRESLSSAIDSSKADLEKTVNSIREDIQSDVSGLKETVSELTKRVDALDENVDGVAKRVDGVVSETAVKKSGDLGKEQEKLEKKDESIWQGSFLPVNKLSE